MFLTKFYCWNGLLVEERLIEALRYLGFLSQYNVYFLPFRLEAMPGSINKMTGNSVMGIIKRVATYLLLLMLLLMVLQVILWLILDTTKYLEEAAFSSDETKSV